MTEDTRTEELQTETVEAMSTSEEPTDDTNLELPDEGVSERTRKEFEKLKEQLRLEKQKNSQPKAASVMEELYPSYIPQPLPQNQSNEDVFTESGEVDIALLNKTLKEANDRAMRAEQLANEVREQSRRFEETQAVKQVHKEFPELDPSNPAFDSRFYELVKNDLIGQMMNGKQNIREAAVKVTEFYKPGKSVNEVQSQAVEEYKRNISQKEHASSISSSKSVSSTDLEELRSKTRLGDKDALYARLKAIGS